MAITTDWLKGAIIELGSGKMWIKEVKDDGTDTTVADTWHKFPIIKDSALKYSVEKKVKPDEGGVEYSMKGKKTGTFSGTVMQSDKATLDLFVKDLDGKYAALFKEMSVDKINGKAQYCLMGLASITPSLDYKVGSGEVAFEFTLYPAPAAITLNIGTAVGLGASSGATFTLAGTITQALGTYFEVFEFTPE